jgi:hypothetical protein
LKQHRNKIGASRILSAAYGSLQTTGLFFRNCNRLHEFLVIHFLREMDFVTKRGGIYSPCVGRVFLNLARRKNKVFNAFFL